MGETEVSVHNSSNSSERSWWPTKQLLVYQIYPKQMIVLTVVTSAQSPYIIHIMISWNHDGLCLTLEHSCLINMMRSWAISEDSPRWPDQYFWEWFDWRSDTMFTLPSLWQDLCLVNLSYHLVSTLQAMRMNCIKVSNVLKCLDLINVQIGIIMW